MATDGIQRWMESGEWVPCWWMSHPEPVLRSSNQRGAARSPEASTSTVQLPTSVSWLPKLR